VAAKSARISSNFKQNEVERVSLAYFITKVVGYYTVVAEPVQ
jgi:hypothetical protein